METAALRLGVAVLCLAAVGAQFTGYEVGSLSTLAHLVSGKVYALNQNTLLLENFNYDGTGPAGWFYVGTSGSAPSSNGQIIPDENGGTDRLGRYSGQTLTLTLPSGLPVSTLRWFSVWCVDFNQDFGSVVFPAGFTGPGPRSVGEFSQLAHQVRSGDVEVKDTKTISIRGLHYDGRGPDAYFIVGTKLPVATRNDYKKIPDESGRTAKLLAYSGADITLTLPAGISIHDIRYLSMYCILASQDFGNVMIPADLVVPFHPDTLTEIEQSQLDNCETLDDGFNLAWTSNSTHITFEAASRLESDEYMAFGLSGSNMESVMRGGDVIVARYDQSPMAVDYYLEAYAQCSNGNGACPDELSGGTQDTRVIGGSKVNGLVKVKVVRALQTGDSPADKAYTPGTEQYIIWAKGRLNDNTYVLKHTSSDRLTGNKKLDFGRSKAWRCGVVTAPTEPEVKMPGWEEQRLRGSETDRATFDVTIGPTGGDRGYKHITGKSSWGIAYWINGLLIPRLQLKRGVEYTFVIRAGDVTSNTAKYHPFYLTNSEEGGYVQLGLSSGASQPSNHQVYAGINTNTNQPLPNSVGPYCEYRAKTGIDQADQHNTFQAYRRTLTDDPMCDSGGPIGTFTFTPDENTPNLIYYQCFTHLNLGWKIEIVNDYKPWPTPAPTPASIAAPRKAAHLHVLLLSVGGLLAAHLLL